MHHSTSLQTLLKQEDMRGTPSYGISQRFKNFKYSSQSILSKKMTALKTKLSDTGMPEEPEESVPVVCPKRKKGIFKRTVSDSNAMAAILVRSVINAHNSLDCILETHDKPASQKQISLTENSNDQPIVSIKYSPELESCLSLPDTSQETRSSEVSSSDSSSDIEDNLSDTKDSSDGIVLDTVSDIVKNVQILQRKLSLQAQSSSDRASIQSDYESYPEKEFDHYLDEKNQYNVVHKDYYFKEANKDPPMAEIENFTVEDEDLSSPEEPLEQSLNEPNSKSIIPRASNVKSGGLFQTAMQTMLLEKVSMVGTYTPSTSPNTKEIFDYKSKTEGEVSEQPIETEVQFKREKSPTSFSLIDFDQKESVLGTPFKSVYDIKHEVSSLERRNTAPHVISLDIHENKKHKHFPTPFKSIHNIIWHKHSKKHRSHSPSSLSLNEFPAEKESLGLWLSHKIKHKKHERDLSPTSLSLVDHGEYKGGAFLGKHKLTHQKHQRGRSPTSISLVDYNPAKEGVFSHFTSLSRRLTHRKHHQSNSPTSVSLVDFDTGKEGVLGRIAFLTRKLTHKKHRRHHSPTSVSLTDFGLRENVLGGPFVKRNQRIPTSISLIDLNEKENVLGGPFIWKKPTEVEKKSSNESNDEEHKAKEASSSSSRNSLNDIENKFGLSENENNEEKCIQSLVNSDIPITNRNENLSSVRRRTFSEHATSTNPPSFNRTRTYSENQNETCSRPRTYSDSHKSKIKAKRHFLKQPLLSSLRLKKEKSKPRGLLQTALQNVLMESVNDILATSHSDSKENIKSSIELRASDDREELINPDIFKQIDENLNRADLEEPITSPLSDVDDNSLSQRPTTSIVVAIPSSEQATSSPINTKIDVGLSDNINTTHAGLTPSPRKTGSPLPEINRPEQGHQRTESVGAKMSHSPAKINTIPCIHRRSSDSDLSITPKGTQLFIIFLKHI